MSKFKRLIVALMMAPILFLTACGVSTPPDSTKVQVGGGMFEDAKFKGCIPPSTKKNSPTNDDYYAYPANERDLDATGQDGSDFKAITVLSKDNAEMSIPITFRFNMVGDCETLQDFHRAYGSRYAAYLNDDGTSSEGWMLMLRKLVYDPADATLDEIAKKYTWREMLNNAEAQNEIQASIVENIDEILIELHNPNPFFAAQTQHPYRTIIPVVPTVVHSGYWMNEATNSATPAPSVAITTTAMKATQTTIIKMSRPSPNKLTVSLKPDRFFVATGKSTGNSIS